MRRLLSLAAELLGLAVFLVRSWRKSRLPWERLREEILEEEAAYEELQDWIYAAA